MQKLINIGPPTSARRLGYEYKKLSNMLNGYASKGSRYLKKADRQL